MHVHVQAAKKRVLGVTGKNLGGKVRQNKSKIEGNFSKSTNLQNLFQY